MSYNALAQIASLNDMSGKELRTLWKSLFDQETHTNQKSYLISRLAYRIQELAYGGISIESKKDLEDLVSGKIDLEKQNKRMSLPPIGTRFIREYKGVEHTVMVIRTGFEYSGRTFTSLSEIAREITGTRWSGPVFFGLKKDTKKKKVK